MSSEEKGQNASNTLTDENGRTIDPEKASSDENGTAMDPEKASSSSDTKQDATEERDPNIVDWDGPVDDENPMYTPAAPKNSFVRSNKHAGTGAAAPKPSTSPSSSSPAS